LSSYALKVKNMPRLSVVILCYKAGDAVSEFASRVQTIIERVTEDWEIILVGNYNQGEADSTPAVVHAIAATDPRYKALTLLKQGMMGWDARSGLHAATGDMIAIIDGDNQMPPEDIARVYTKLLDEDLDMAMTYRNNRQDSLIRRYNSKIFNLIFSFLFPGYPVRDVNAKPKIFTRSFLGKLRLEADDWFFDTEIMIQARRHCAKLGQIPTTFYRSMDRKSFVRSDAILEFVKNLLRARFREFFIKP